MKNSEISIHPTPLSIMREKNPDCDISEKAVFQELADLGENKVMVVVKNDDIHVWFEDDVVGSELARQIASELARINGLDAEKVGLICATTTAFVERVMKISSI